MTVVLLTGDLMVQSRVAGAAEHSGLKMQNASTADQAASICREQSTDLLLVDLATPSLDVAELVAAVKHGANTGIRVVAFGPHVHKERLATARDAGCDTVMSRGQFFSQVDEILGRHVAE